MKKHEELFRHRNGLCDCDEKTDTTQNKPTCCEKCASDTPWMNNACWDVSCPCHVKQANLQEASSHTQTTPSEEWEIADMVQAQFPYLSDAAIRDGSITPVNIQNLIASFAEKIRTAAYEEGKNSREPQTFSMKKLQQDAYEKGVRDSLEVVEGIEVKEIVGPENHEMNGKSFYDWQGRGLFIQGENSMMHRCIQAISTLLK